MKICASCPQSKNENCPGEKFLRIFWETKFKEKGVLKFAKIIENEILEQIKIANFFGKNYEVDKICERTVVTFQRIFQFRKLKMRI